MPTFARSDAFKRDYKDLTDEQRSKFKVALRAFVDDLLLAEASGVERFRPALRVKPMRKHKGVWEMTWEIADGRATFKYGEPVVAGLHHVEWRRCGTHAVFAAP